ncbi:MAG: Hsp20/alpha crystallin family protein [Deferrisomatales bacterium]|nr:Hsp20/alpha crystallin family protein [Deferrisomatales bacterium]
MAAWDPLRELERLRREMDRIFEGVSPARTWSLGFLPGTAARQYPRVNIAEDADGYVVEALAPGVDPTTLDLSVKDNVLTISGEKKAPEGVRAEAFHRSERSAGRFVRAVELPDDLNAEQVKAAYTDGILRVNLPKAEQAKPRRIEIDLR